MTDIEVIITQPVIEVKFESTLNTGGGGAVDSVNGQTGDVVLTTTDINEGTNQYFTDARAIAALATTLLSYVTTTALNTALSAYVTAVSLASTLANYVTNSSLATTLSNYVTNSSLATTLANYVTLATDQTISALKTFTNGITLTPQATPTYARGRVFFDDANDCLAFMDSISGRSVQVGYEVLMLARNNTGVQINNGQVVYISGSTGTNSTVALASANAESTSMIIGIATHNIAINTVGKIVVFGLANDLDTSAFTDGQEVFLSAATSGALTATPPASPNYVVRVGVVERAHPTQGKILVHPDTALSNNNSLGTSQGVAPTQNAVKTYADTLGTRQVIASNTIAFDNPKQFGSVASPRSGALLTDYTSARNGLVALVYHNDTSLSFPVSWTNIGAIQYTASQTNVICVAFIGNSKAVLTILGTV